MLELLHFAVTPANILYTVLMMFILVYWLFVIIGALDMGAVDFDVDVDADVDMDAAMDVEGGSSFANALHFLNFGQLPFMVIMTVWVVSMWVMGILSNFHYGHGSLTFAAIWFLPILCTGLVITKLLTTPLIPIFKNLDTYAKPIEYIGQTGIVTLPASVEKFGQAEVMVENNNALISIKANRGEVQRGEEVMIIEEIKNKYFIVERL